MLNPKLVILLLPLLVAACASDSRPRSLVVAAQNTAEVDRSGDGSVTLRSQLTHIVSVMPLNERFSGDTRALPSFYVIVTNGGKENLPLKPGDVSAYAGSRRIVLLDPVALQDRLDGEANGSKTNFPISMRDASQSAELRHGELPALDYPRDSSQETTRVAPTGPTYPSVEPFGAPKFKIPARLVASALQPQIIPPGEVGGGRITLESQTLAGGLPLKIVVSVAGEKHEFLFEVQY